MMIGENVNHTCGFTLRINGAGNLRSTFYDLDKQRSDTNVPLVMSTLTGTEPFKIGDFTSQRIILRLETRDMDEIFKINRIIIWMKSVFTGYPNG